MSNSTRQPRGPTLDPLLLQAYFDGELDADEAARVEQLLVDSGDDQLRLEALGEMHELVRFDVEQRVEDVELGGLWSRIERELDAEQVLERNERQAPTLAAPAPAAPESLSWWSAVKAFFAGHKAVLVPTLVAATIIMLVVVPLLLNQAPPERVVERERTIVVIDEPLRFEGNSTGTVSYTPGTNTPVIWYLGEPNANNGAVPDDNSTVDPALLRRDISLPIPVDKLLERLERLERLVVPNSNTTPTPPPVDDRTGRTPQDGPI